LDAREVPEGEDLNWKKYSIALALLIVACTLGPWVYDYYDLNSIPHVSIKYGLGALGASIYEYHSLTGHWPSRAEDMASTSLPQKSPYWKRTVDIGSDVIVFHNDLKPEPKDNANVILAYHPKGLFAELGRTWICWGDLRLEFLKTDELRRRLARKERSTAP
jgi:hypothetical protein